MSLEPLSLGTCTTISWRGASISVAQALFEIASILVDVTCLFLFIWAWLSAVGLVVALVLSIAPHGDNDWRPNPVGFAPEVQDRGALHHLEVQQAGEERRLGSSR